MLILRPNGRSGPELRPREGPHFASASASARAVPSQAPTRIQNTELFLYLPSSQFRQGPKAACSSHPNLRALRRLRPENFLIAASPVVSPVVSPVAPASFARNPRPCRKSKIVRPGGCFFRLFSLSLCRRIEYERKNTHNNISNFLKKNGRKEIYHL